MNTLLERVDNLLQKAKYIDGWFSKADSDLLFETVSHLTGNGCIVEIGSWCGKSLTYLTAGALKAEFKNKIYSIDPFLTSTNEPNGIYETFITNLKRLGIYENIIHIKEKSQIAGLHFNDDIEFIFIDGFHKYDAVKKDFELFYPKVIENGFIAFHDVFSFAGPTKLLSEIINVDNSFKVRKIGAGILLAQKVSQLSKEDKEFNQKVLKKLTDSLATDILK